MASDNLPQRDSELRAWAANFAAHLQADAPRFGISADDAAAFALLSQSYALALAAALEPDTRTRPRVAAKNSARAALRAGARKLWRIVSAHPGLTSSDRVALGLTPPGRHAKPAGPPVTRPMVLVDPRGRVRLVDHDAPGRRRKPPGVIGALLFTRIDGAAPQGAQDAQFAALATRDRCTLALSPQDRSRTLWVLAQWVNSRGETGPLSAPARTVIAA